MSPKTKAKPRRVSLSRELILEAAFRIADVFGVPLTDVFQWDAGAVDPDAKG